MKTIEELKAQLARSISEREQFWDEFQIEEKKEKENPRVKSPAEIAHSKWYEKSKEVDLITGTLGLLGDQ